MKRAARRAASGEDRFFALALDMLCVATFDGYFARVNSPFEETLGYTTEELLSRPFMEFVHPDDREATLAELARLKKGEKTTHFENRYVRKNGSYARLAWKAVPVLEENLVYATIRDVTARRSAEERAEFLSGLNGALQPLTDPGEAMAVTARMLGEHLGADRCAYAEVEEDEDHFEITGDYTNGVASIIGRFAMSQFGAEALRLMRSNEAYVVEDSEDDGRVGEPDLPAYRMTEIRAVVCVPLHKAGRFVAGMAVHQKTPRKWTEEEVELVTTVVERCWESIERARTVRSMRKSEERYRTLIAASTSIVWIVDPDGRFSERQPSWEAYTGQAWEEYRGFGWERTIHPDDRERILEIWERALASRGLYATDGRLWHAPSGAYRHFIARALPLLDEEGEVREWIGMIADVEDLKRAEAEILRLNARLEERVRERTAELAEAVEELEAFSYSVSHDLRAPIRHIGGFSRMLEERCGDVLDETGKRYLETIMRANHRAGALVDDLLAFSRMGRSDMQRAAVDMNALVKDILEELEPDMNGRRIDWRISELPPIRGDYSMLRLTVRNLLANAVKYTRPRREAKIEVGTFEEGEEFVVFVKDNGVGFDMAYVDKLFGVFQRLHGPEEFEGTGIGLASVKRVVRRHGGRVWAEGAPDEGAAFYFSLPKTKAR